MYRVRRIEVPEERWQNVFTFLKANPGTCPEGKLIWKGIAPGTSVPAGFTLIEKDAHALHLGFTLEGKGDNQLLLDSPGSPLLLNGFGGLPDKPDHVCIPFEGMRFSLKWVRELIEEAERLGWHPRLVYCEKGFIPHEVMRIADWFHLDAVKEALARWVTEDVRQAFGDLMERYPDLRVETGIGRLKKMLASEDPSETIIMGSLTPGYHLPMRHHGVHYASILSETGLSGYFV